MSRETIQGTGQGRGPGAPVRAAVPWLVATLALGVLAVVLGIARLEELPDPYPVHFGPVGDPDRFVQRGPASVLVPVVVGQACALAVFATLLLPRTPRALVTPVSVLGLVVGGGIALISIAQYLSSDALAPAWGFWLLLVAIVAATAWVLVTSARVGSRADGEGQEGWRLGGLVYAAPDDPAVIVPRRVGGGATVNLGRPMGWLLLGLLLVPAALVVYLVVALG